MAELCRAHEPVRVLVVEDNQGDADLLQEYLDDGWVMTHVPTLWAARAVVAKQTFDVALVDAHLPDAQGVDAVDSLVRLGRFPVILLTGTDSIELASNAAQSGAHECLIKGEVTPRQLKRALMYAVEKHQSLLQFRALLYQSPDGVLIVDSEGEVLLANGAACQAFGVSERELVGLRIGIPSAQITELELASGRTIESHSAEVMWRERKAFLIHLRDVTERNRMMTQLASVNQKLADLALNDPLTGLLNRRGAEKMLAHLASSATRTDERVTAVLIDCDDFKSINEAGGYTSGDSALQLVAEAMRVSTRPSRDQLCRIGGDEFLILLPATTEAQALVVAERIREVVRSKPLPEKPGLRSFMTVSIGVAEVPDDCIVLKDVIESAQLSLARSKQRGKDRVSLSQSEPQDPDVNALLTIIDQSELEIRPIITTSTRRASGYELLARAAGHAATASALCPNTARSSVLAMVDLHCFRTALATGAATCRGERTFLSLRPNTLLATPPDELERLFSRIRSEVVLMLSERELVGDPSQLLPPLAVVRSLGVLFGLDGIGFGKSALESLIVLEPDVVRLDSSMVTRMTSSAGTVRNLRRLVACVQSLDASIIATGVDDEATARTLEAEGVSYLQGAIAGGPKVVRVDSTLVCAA